MYVSDSPFLPPGSTNGRVSPKYTSEWTVAEGHFSPSVAGFSDAWLTAQNHYHDMHSYNPNYMVAPEVTHEFNLLNDFLHTSMLDDGGLLSDESQNSPTFKRSSQNDMPPGFTNNVNALPPAGGSDGPS